MKLAARNGNVEESAVNFHVNIIQNEMLEFSCVLLILQSVISFIVFLSVGN